MSDRLYLIGYKDGKAQLFSSDEIIENARQQELDGIEPLYSWYDYKTGETVTPPGWLVWSTMKGCGVVYRRHDGKMIIVTGVQGDFCCNLGE